MVMGPYTGRRRKTRKTAASYDKLSSYSSIIVKEFRKEGYVQFFLTADISQREEELLLDYYAKRNRNSNATLLQYYPKEDKVVSNVQCFFEKKNIENAYDKLVLWKVLAPNFIYPGIVILLYLLLFYYTSVTYYPEVFIVSRNVFYYILLYGFSTILLFIREYFFMKRILDLNFYEVVNFLFSSAALIVLVIMPYKFPKNPNTEPINNFLGHIPGIVAMFFSLMFIYVPLILMILTNKPLKRYSRPNAFEKLKLTEVKEDYPIGDFQPLKLSLEQEVQMINSFLPLHGYKFGINTFIQPLSSYDWFQQYLDEVYRGKVVLPIGDPEEHTARKIFLLKLPIVLALLPAIINLALVYVNLWSELPIAFFIIFTTSCLIVLAVELFIKHLILRNVSSLHNVYEAICLNGYVFDGKNLYLRFSSGKVFKTTVSEIRKHETSEIYPFIFATSELNESLIIECGKTTVIMMGEQFVEPQKKKVKK